MGGERINEEVKEKKERLSKLLSDLLDNKKKGIYIIAEVHDELDLNVGISCNEFLAAGIIDSIKFKLILGKAAETKVIKTKEL